MSQQLRGRRASLTGISPNESPRRGDGGAIGAGGGGGEERSRGSRRPQHAKMLRELKPDANVCPGLQQNAKRHESHANDQRSLPLGLQKPSRLSPHKGSKSKTQRFHEHRREPLLGLAGPSCVMFKPSGRSHRFWPAERVEIAVQLWAACH